LQNQEYLDRRIDLGDLLKIILKKKFFILGLTFLFTLIAVVYVYTKTPIYQAKVLVEIGSYKIEKKDDKDLTSSIEAKQVDDINQLVKKLSTIFIDLKKNDKNKNTQVVNISALKGMNSFLEITVESVSNELAVNTINDILLYIQDEHKNILNDVKEKNNLEIKNINLMISNIENEKIININKKIQVYEQNIIILEEQLKFLSETFKNNKVVDYSFTTLKLMEKRDVSNEITNNKFALSDLNETKRTLLDLDINKLLERKNLLETLSLPHNIKNSEIVGKIQLDEDPIKPKKALIILTSILTGLTCSLFLVFLINGFSRLNNKDNK